MLNTQGYDADLLKRPRRTLYNSVSINFCFSEKKIDDLKCELLIDATIEAINAPNQSHKAVNAFFCAELRRAFMVETFI